MEVVCITGGTGFLGSLLETHFRAKGIQVVILTRSPRADNHIFWNPETGEIDIAALTEVTQLVHLSGAGIAERRWTDKRMKELYASRVDSTRLIAAKSQQMPRLKSVLCASGIDGYELNSNEPSHESEPLGNHKIGRLVAAWEKEMDGFPRGISLAKMRLGVVLHPEGGALAKLLKIIATGLASQLGKGHQAMNWMHHQDVCSIFELALQNQWRGAYNICANSTSNAELMKSLARASGKPMVMPNVPSWILKVALGEMSTMLLRGRAASNEKIRSMGYQLSHPKIEGAIQDLIP